MSNFKIVFECKIKMQNCSRSSEINPRDQLHSSGVVDLGKSVQNMVSRLSALLSRSILSHLIVPLATDIFLQEEFSTEPPIVNRNNRNFC